MLNFNFYYDEDNNYEDYINDEEDQEDQGPALEIYGTDLTLMAKEGKLEECFGREKELLEMMEILVRRQKNNPVLVGDAGVGKTAIVELFATKIVNNLVPFVLEGRTLISLDLARIVAGSRYRGEFELRFQKVLDEVLAQPNIIIFIDEIHNLGGTGSAEGSLDAANILKPVLSRSGFQCIGATTTKEYQKIEKDPALNRRFQPIKVKEPSIEETVHILYGLRPSLEAFHNVEILPGAIQLAAELSARYIYDRFLPDKAIDLIDRAAAKEVIRLTNVTEGSVIGSMVNASINSIGTLRVEAFRRGDIASEFILQEIENAYRNYLLRWIEEPLTIPEQSKLMLSPISQSLFDTMRMSILKHVDDLLFSSSRIRVRTQTVHKVRTLSKFTNQKISYEMLFNLGTNLVRNRPDLSLYRLGLQLSKKALKRISLKRTATFPTFRPLLKTIETKFNPFLLPSSRTETAIQPIVQIFHSYPSFETGALMNHLRNYRKKCGETTIVFNSVNDFNPQDIEAYEETHEILSELEQKRIEVFIGFMETLQPLLRKGLIESLKYSSEIKVTDSELVTIYNLLGYFATETGKEFLYSIDDPELIQRARKLGDFSGLKTRIGQNEVRLLLANMTGIPLQSISAVESYKLISLESTLHQRVIGQDEAISAISKAIRRSRLGIQNPNRPIASFLFCGPTGVGKTEVSKALAVSMFGAESDMIRFDMSEFMEKFTVSRLIGSPPGYVGYDEGGQLTDAVRRKPYAVVLFDEVEKAHPDILNILLQILEDGRLTDSQKRLIPFENTIIIMTSNAASDEIQQIINAEELKEEKNEKDEKASVSNNLNKQLPKKVENPNEKSIVVRDAYAGAIEFLLSPITENFLVDLSYEINGGFENSLLNESYGVNLLLKSSEKSQVVEIQPEDIFQPGEIIPRNPLESSFPPTPLVIDVEGEVLSLDGRNLTEEENKEKEKVKRVNANLKGAVLDRLSTMFLPEFLNRLDDIIVFQPLKAEELRKICDLMVNEVVKRLEPKQIILTVDDRVKEKLTREGYNPSFGARPLRRLITKYVEDLISDEILNYECIEKFRKIDIKLNHKDQVIVQR